MKECPIASTPAATHVYPWCIEVRTNIEIEDDYVQRITRQVEPGEHQLTYTR